MNRPILACALLVFAAATLGAQEASQPSPYEGTSTPPADDTITTSTPEQAKPPAGRHADDQNAPEMPASAQPQNPPSQSMPDHSTEAPDSGGDNDIVQVGKSSASRPAEPGYVPDPDGDIVHPRPARQGEIVEGTTIRVRLLDRLSTVSTEKGEAFRSRVASDVYQSGKVLIPAGTEIDGRVVDVSSGHAGGHGSMRLRPETVQLADGTRYRLHAELSGTPGSKTRIGAENSVVPDSQVKKDGIEYGGAMGGGAVTGAVLGGPVGALTGTLVGAGLVTVHLLVSHPQATLESGTVLLFTLTEPLELVPAGDGNNN